MFRNAPFLLFFVALAACGGRGSTPDVAAYSAAVSDVQASVTGHQASAAAAQGSADCTAEHQRYDGEVRPRVKHMLDMSGGMDGCMRDMGHGDQADMHGMCDSMMGELDRHHAAACAGDDAANHAEAAHHCQMMRDWLDREHSRADSMNGMMGSGGMMSGGRCSR
jgi:hypothetical protein